MNGINKNQTLKMLTPLHENNPWRLHQKSPLKRNNSCRQRLMPRHLFYKKLKKIRQKSKDTRNVGLSWWHLSVLILAAVYQIYIFLSKKKQNEDKEKNIFFEINQWRNMTDIFQSCKKMRYKMRHDRVTVLLVHGPS